MIAATFSTQKGSIHLHHGLNLCTERGPPPREALHPATWRPSSSVLPFTATFVFHYPSAFPGTCKEHPPPAPQSLQAGSLPQDLSGSPVPASCSKEEVKVTCLLPSAVSLTLLMYLGHEWEHGSALPWRLKSSLTCGFLLDASPNTGTLRVSIPVPRDSDRRRSHKPLP